MTSVRKPIDAGRREGPGAVADDDVLVNNGRHLQKRPSARYRHGLVGSPLSRQPVSVVHRMPRRVRADGQSRGVGRSSMFVQGRNETRAGMFGLWQDSKWAVSLQVADCAVDLCSVRNPGSNRALIRQGSTSRCLQRTARSNGDRQEYDPDV